jgi:hypothetical protein
LSKGENVTHVNRSVLRQLHSVYESSGEFDVLGTRVSQLIDNSEKLIDGLSGLG